jgi:hypothetical protein
MTKSQHRHWVSAGSHSIIHALFLFFADDLLLRLDFRDPDPEVIDLSPVGGVVSTLQESKVECLSSDKARSFASHRNETLNY